MSHLLHVFPLISSHGLRSITDEYQWNAQDYNTDGLLFDNLICKFTFVQRSGKERCMFKGTISELQDSISLVLEIDGYWRTRKDPDHNIFKSTCKKIDINYWLSTQTFTVNGKKEDAVLRKTKQLVFSYKSPSDSTKKN